MFRVIPYKLIGIIAGTVLVLGGVFYIGYQYAHIDELKDRADAIEKAKDIEDEVDNLDDSDLIDGILR